MRQRVRRFKVYPHYPFSKKYYLVEVYATRVVMLKAIEKWGEPVMPDTEACCIQLIPRKRAKKAGVMIFHERGLTPETIAHEIDHAATFWTQMYEPRTYRYIYSNPLANESRALLVDRMTGQFYSQLPQP